MSEGSEDERSESSETSTAAEGEERIESQPVERDGGFDRLETAPVSTL